MTAETHSPFQGSIVALPTPFMDGGLDLRGVSRLVEFHATFGSDGILVGGAVGEGWSLSFDETAQLVSRASELAAHHSRFTMRVIYGIAEIDSRRAARLSEQAALAGADGIAVAAPPSTRARATDVIRHLSEIAERLPTAFPLMLVNDPERTAVDLTPDIVAEVASHFGGLRAHCEGVGFPGRARSLPRRLDDVGLATLTGDDRMIGPYMRSGAVGAVNTVGNLVPGEVLSLLASIHRDGHDADQRERALAPLIDTLRLAPGAKALKTALALLEAIGPDLRPPLAPLSQLDRSKVTASLESARLLVPSLPA